MVTARQIFPWYDQAFEVFSKFQVTLGAGVVNKIVSTIIVLGTTVNGLIDSGNPSGGTLGSIMPESTVHEVRHYWLHVS